MKKNILIFYCDQLLWNALGYVGTGKLKAIGSCLKDASPFGVMDMAGNVREWVWDKFDAKYYSGSPRENPFNDAGAGQNVFRVIRGGCFALTEWDSRTTSRGNRRFSYYSLGTGFRCVEAGLPPTTPKNPRSSNQK